MSDDIKNLTQELEKLKNELPKEEAKTPLPKVHTSDNGEHVPMFLMRQRAAAKKEEERLAKKKAGLSAHSRPYSRQGSSGIKKKLVIETSKQKADRKAREKREAAAAAIASQEAIPDPGPTENIQELAPRYFVRNSGEVPDKLFVNQVDYDSYKESGNIKSEGVVSSLEAVEIDVENEDDAMILENAPSSEVTAVIGIECSRLVSRFPKRLHQYFHRINPNDLLKSEGELTKELKPNATINKLRISMWQELDRSPRSIINMKNVVKSIATERYLEDRVFDNPKTLAWFIKPPAKYEETLEEALYFGINRLREILEAPFYKMNGEFDPLAAQVVLKTVDKIDMRIKGLPTQNIRSDIRQVTRTVSGHTTPDTNKIDMTGLISASDLDKKIRELEGKKELQMNMIGMPQLPDLEKDIPIVEEHSGK